MNVPTFWAVWWDNRGVEQHHYVLTVEDGMEWLRQQGETVVGWVIRESWSHGWKAIQSGDLKALRKE